MEPKLKGWNAILRAFLTEPQITLVLSNFSALVFLFVPLFGCPFVDPVFIARMAFFPAVPTSDSCTLGVLGSCCDFNFLEGPACSRPLVGYPLDAPFSQPAQDFGPIAHLNVSAFLDPSFNMQSATESLILNAIAFLLSLVCLTLIIVGQWKLHVLSRWSFQLTLLLNAVTIAATVVDVIFVTSLNHAALGNAKVTAGNGVYFTMLAAISLSAGAVLFKIQQIRLNRTDKLGGGEGDHEMAILQGTGKGDAAFPEEIETEQLRKLRELLYNTLDPKGTMSPKRTSVATKFMPLDGFKGSSTENTGKQASNYVTEDWPDSRPESPENDRLKPHAILVNGKHAGRHSPPPYISHSRSRSVPFPMISSERSSPSLYSVFGTDSLYPLRIIPESTYLAPSPISAGPAAPSSGIPSNISSRRASSSQKSTTTTTTTPRPQSLTNPSTLSQPQRTRSQRSRKPRRSHVGYSPLGLYGRTMASSSVSTLGSVLNDFPTVPPFEPSYYPYGIHRLGGRRQVLDPHTNPSSTTQNGPSSSRSTLTSPAGVTQQEDVKIDQQDVEIA
ncbi:hypothetical protein D9613_004191 [Agrocybe pediades]|uniref:Uncharacterized protein n=1 Tax=Agrocybe pediades TaxID=84607 RepID=A0A8H4QK86_9AGAR|nr:hypothetical protein D9613_004191 [Agrocybe pediades]